MKFLSLALLLVPRLALAAIPTVTITGSVVDPGAVGVQSGSITCSLSQPGSALDGAVSRRVGARVTTTLGAGGALTGFALVPNDIITPSGTAYSCRYFVTTMDGAGTSWTETWQLTSTPNPIDIGAITRVSTGGVTFLAGPVGPTGPTGATGPTGPAGPVGSVDPITTTPAALCNGVNDDGPALAAAQVAAGTTKAIRVTCKLRIASAVGTLSAPVIFEGSGMLWAVTGGSVTLAGPFTAPLDQVFYAQGGTITVSSPMDAAKPHWWGASGSATATTGSITTGTNTLTVASAGDFQVGQGISVVGAGAAGALLVTSITAISGTTFTLAANAGTTAAAQAVNHDDTAAIQTAINAAPAVYLPAGTFRITSQIATQANTYIRGAGSWGNGTASAITKIDASTITAVTALQAPGNAVGTRFEGFWLHGPPPASAGAGNGGIYPTGSGGNITIRNVVIDGFNYGIYLDACIRAQITAVYATNAKTAGLWVNGGSEISITDGMFANSGTAGADVDTGNVVIAGGATGVSLRTSLIDEGGGASVLVLGASNITIDVPLVYLSAGGCGIRLGNGVTNPTNVTIYNANVQPFTGGRVPVNTIRLFGSGHRLVNVITNPATGGDIQDNATDTVYENVNGQWKQPTTDASGTPGTATINKASGKVAIAAAAASVVVTDSLVTAASIVTATMQATDATCTGIKSVVPAAGSFTITANAACALATKIAFTVQN